MIQEQNIKIRPKFDYFRGKSRTAMEDIKESNEEFSVTTSDWSDRIGKTLFTSDLSFIRCVSGSAGITIDSAKHTLTANHSFILSEYTAFQVLEKAPDFSVVVISVSLPFYYEIIAGFDGTVFSALLESAPELYEEPELQAADLLFDSLVLLYDKPGHNNHREFAKNLITCYIYEILELTLPFYHGDSSKRKNDSFTDIIARLYNLVSEYGSRNRSIGFYAEKLGVSSRYLHTITRSVCRETPKRLIDNVVISLIKKQIVTTSLNNQQLSDKFNFSDQSAFGQFFKRCAGVSPSEFRTTHK